MNEKLAAILKLDPKAYAKPADLESAIVSAVQALADQAAAAAATVAAEDEINKVIRAGGGGIGRSEAVRVIANRKAFADANKPKPKDKKK